MKYFRSFLLLAAFVGLALHGQAQKATAAKALAEEALKNAKNDIDIAMAQSELAVMAAQIAALRKYRQKK